MNLKAHTFQPSPYSPLTYSHSEDLMTHQPRNFPPYGAPPELYPAHLEPAESNQLNLNADEFIPSSKLPKK